MGWGEGEYEMLQSAPSRVINSDGACGREWGGALSTILTKNGTS